MKKKFSLSAVALTAALAAPAFAGPGLADGAAKFVGNITQSNQVPGANDEFTKLWNQATAENGCKWGSVEGQRGNFNWSGCDAAYKWAKNNGGHFKFHALLWGSQYPSWLESLSVEDTKKAITTWFDKVKERYPDAEMIDVVNEAIRTGNGQYHSNYTKTKIIQAMGGDNNGDYAFITTAFKMARERWPKAILIYNDYNTVQWNKDQGIQLIQTIKKNGAPVDAYGLQAHDMQIQGGGNNGTGASGDCLAISTLKNILNEIWEKTQTPILISEYDIATENDNIQKQCYSEQVGHFMENEHIAGITIWGYIYGRTWTTNGNSGIIKNGNDRPAMTWLRDYLSKNKGVNTTGILGGTTVDPEPQTPFKGKPFAVPGKIEAEDFDIPGVGRNEDGSSNMSYSVGTSGKGDSDYRKDEGVNLYKNATGVVIGYNEKGNWYEYTIDVAETGSYTIYAAVASANNTSSFKFSIGDKDITEEISVPQASSGEDNYSDYNKVPVEVNLTKGKQILRLNVTGDWFDIDYFNIVPKGEADPNPIEKDPAEGGDKPSEGDKPGVEDPSAIAQNLQLNVNTLQKYDVFDMQGVRIGRLGAYSFEQAIETVKFGNVKLSNGVYSVRNVNTKQMQTFRIEK